MIFLFSVYIFFISWLTVYKYNVNKKKGLLTNEYIKQYRNRLLRNIIIAFLVVFIVNIIDGIVFTFKIIDGTNGEYFNLPENMTGEWEKYIDLGFLGYLLFQIPGKIFQFFLRTVFVVCSMFIFHSKYLIKNCVVLPKYLVWLLYILAILNGIYMVSELLDFIQSWSWLMQLI